MTEAEELEALVKRIMNEQTSLDQYEDLYNKMGLIKFYTDDQVKKALEPNEKNILNYCLSYRHDFGLMNSEDKKNLEFECKEWLRAISNNQN